MEKISLRQITTKEDIKDIDAADTMIHLAFRPSSKDVLQIVALAPKLKMMHIPGSYVKTLSKSIQMLLNMQGIMLVVGENSDFNDIFVHYMVPRDSVIGLIGMCKEKKYSEDETIEQLQKTFAVKDGILRAIISSVLSFFLPGEIKMEFVAACGCKINMRKAGLISDLDGVEPEKTKVVFICQHHKYELLLAYLKEHKTITFSWIKRVFRLPESEITSLLGEIDNDPSNGVFVTVSDFVVTCHEV